MSRDRTLLLISPVFPPHKAGGADYALRLAQEVGARGVDVTVVTSKSVGATEFDGISCCPTMESWSWRQLPKLLKLIGRVQPNVIDIHFTGWAYAEHPMITMFPAFLVRHFPEVRLVTHIEFIRGIDRSAAAAPSLAVRKLFTHLFGRKDISYDYGYLLRESKSLIVLGEWERDQLTAQHGDQLKQKIVVAPPGPIMPISQPLTDEERVAIRCRLGFTANDFVVAFFGYMFPGKGIEVLLRAASKLAHKVPIQVMMVGDTPEPAVMSKIGDNDYIGTLKKLCQGLGISERVAWTGYTASDSTEASKFLRISDICALPFDTGVRLHRSSFSFAAAHGLPIISTRAERMETPFIEGNNILLVEPTNVDQLAGAIESLYADRTMRQTLSNGATNMAESLFSWQTTVAKTMESYGYKP